MAWEKLTDVPPSLQLRKGARMSLEQINQVCDRAQALGTVELPDMGRAWQEFEKKHTILDGLWVALGGEN